MFSSFLGTSHDWQETGLCFSVFNTVPVTYGPCWFYSGAPGAWERKLWPHLLLRSNRVFFLPPHFQEHICGDAILNSYLLLPYSHSLWGVWGVSHGMTLLIRTESSPSWMTGFLLEQMRMTVSRHHRTIVRNAVIPLCHDSTCISRLDCHCLPRYLQPREKSHTVVATVNQSSSSLWTESVCLQLVRQEEMRTLVTGIFFSAPC